MKIALMQPYFMPYIGYFQLIHAVDKFIFFDDVNFIKQGWINRNNILLDKKRHRFCLPIKNISSKKNIKDTLIAQQPIHWEKPLLKKIHQAYQKAPYFEPVYPQIEKILRGCAGRSMADVAIESIEQTLVYIGAEENLSRSAGKYNNKHLKLTEKVIDICQKEGATTYVNAFGGQHLFAKNTFDEQGIELLFIKPKMRIYTQFSSDFVGGLSIIDVLMHNDPATIRAMTNDYNLF
jgi:WbqC-like protein family